MLKLLRSIKFAFKGLKTVFLTEKSFRIHLLVACFVILFAWYWGLSETSWIILLLVIALVMALEIFNSAIERLVDILAPKTHGAAREIKDILAAMVLLVVIFAIAIGLIIFFVN